MKKSYLPAGMVKSKKLITTNLKGEGLKVEAARSKVKEFLCLISNFSIDN